MNNRIFISTIFVLLITLIGFYSYNSNNQTNKTDTVTQLSQAKTSLAPSSTQQTAIPLETNAQLSEFCTNLLPSGKLDQLTQQNSDLLADLLVLANQNYSIPAIIILTKTTIRPKNSNEKGETPWFTTEQATLTPLNQAIATGDIKQVAVLSKAATTHSFNDIFEVLVQSTYADTTKAAQIAHILLSNGFTPDSTRGKVLVNLLLGDTSKQAYHDNLHYDTQVLAEEITAMVDSVMAAYSQLRSNSDELTQLAEQCPNEAQQWRQSNNGVITSNRYNEQVQEIEQSRQQYIQMAMQRYDLLKQNKLSEAFELTERLTVAFPNINHYEQLLLGAISHIHLSVDDVLRLYSYIGEWPETTILSFISSPNEGLIKKLIPYGLELNITPYEGLNAYSGLLINVDIDTKDVFQLLQAHNVPFSSHPSGGDNLSSAIDLAKFEPNDGNYFLKTILDTKPTMYPVHQSQLAELKKEQPEYYRQLAELYDLNDFTNAQ